MTTYVALLRAVNLGGDSTLPMADLKAMCVEAGFADVRTYIASGNVVFGSGLSEVEVKAALEARLEAYAGRPVGVLVRDAGEIAAVHAANPFADKPGNRVVAIFLDEAPPANVLETVSRAEAGEEVLPGKRELYVHYPNGQGRSKLKIPAAKNGTARNMNTVAKLAEMAGQTA